MAFITVGLVFACIAFIGAFASCCECTIVLGVTVQDAFWEALLKEPRDRTVEDIETLVENVHELPGGNVAADYPECQEQAALNVPVRQRKKVKFYQSLLISYVPETVDHLCRPALHLFKKLHIFLQPRCPNWHSVFKMWSHKGAKYFSEEFRRKDDPGNL